MYSTFRGCVHVSCFFFYYSSQSKQWSAQFIEATIQRNLPTGHLKFVKSNLYQLFKVVLTVNKMIMVDILSVTLQFIKRKKKIFKYHRRHSLGDKNLVLSGMIVFSSKSTLNNYL